MDGDFIELAADLAGDDAENIAFPGMASQMDTLRVALVHEWLDSYAGSERVVEQILLCFPQAEIYTIVDFMAESERGFLGGRTVHTSFIQRLPFARRLFRLYLGLMPVAVEQIDVTGFDLVISSSHAVAKGVITGPDQLHVSYVHSPMRYAWDLQHQYLRQAKLGRGPKAIYVRWLLSRLRQWDVRTSPGVDIFVANSNYIARRICKAYRRQAVVIHPPVDVESFNAASTRSEYYLVISRQVPYKRIDLIACAFAAMPERRLIIVGEGPEHASIVAAAGKAKNIFLLDAVPYPELVSLMQSARAFVAAAEEDFGITTVEAQASGAPVIAYGRGGAADIVVPPGGSEPPTGILFNEQSAASIIEAVERFEKLSPAISPEACRRNARRFSEEAFRRRFLALVRRALRDRDTATEEAATKQPETKKLKKLAA
jgi:glycosyltransferase involved in cell wall biosynthesis